MESTGSLIILGALPALLLLPELLGDHLVNVEMSVSLGCAGVLDLVSTLHPGEDLHVSVLLRLGVVLKLGKLGIALLLQNLL